MDANGARPQAMLARARPSDPAERGPLRREMPCFARLPAESPGKYFLCRLRGRDVAAVVSPHGAPPPPAPVWSTHIWVDDADESAARVAEMGGRVLGEAFDSPGGGRMAAVQRLHRSAFP